MPQETKKTERVEPTAAAGRLWTMADMVSAVALAALLALSFGWTFRWMYLRWSNDLDYYGHGFLIPIVSAALLYMMRARLAACPRRACPRGMALVVPALLLHLVASAWRVGFLSGLALLVLLAGLVLTLWGRRMLVLTIFPIVFLAFMVPLPFEIIEKASFGMKMLSARVATKVAELIGVVAVREANEVHIETGTLIVDDVCSGLKYLISLMAFAALYAHVSSVKLWGKFILFALSVPIAFLANAGRVTVMILVGYLAGVDATKAWYFHDLFGFALFVIAFIMLFIVEALMGGRLRLKRGEGGGGSADEGPSADEAPIRPGRGVLGALLSVMLVSAALSVFLSWPRGAAPATDTLKAIPVTLGEWRGSDYRMDPRVYRILGTEDVLSRGYRNDHGELVQLLVVMARQARRRTHPPEHCLTGVDYVIRERDDITISLSEGPSRREASVRELILSRPDGHNLLTWYFFKSGDTLRTSYWRHQAGVAMRKFGDPHAADIMIRVDVPVRGDNFDRGRELLRQFLSDFSSPLLEDLP